MSTIYVSVVCWLFLFMKLLCNTHTHTQFPAAGYALLCNTRFSVFSRVRRSDFLNFFK